MWELSVLPTNNTMFPARDRTRTARSGDERTRLLRFKSGGIRWFKWNFRKSKERLKEKNSGTPSESSTPPKGHPGLVGNCLVYVYQFLTSNSNFKTSNRQNFQLIFISINFTYNYPLRKTIYPQIYPNKGRNADMWDEQKDWLLETWTRYFCVQLIVQNAVFRFTPAPLFLLGVT